MNDLQQIFDAITPDNIKDIPLIKDAMGIFTETLEDLAKESIDIKNIYENESIKEELFKMYLNDLFMVFKKVENNQKLVDAISHLNERFKRENGTSEDIVSLDIVYNISNYITKEHFLAFKSFKETKGTKLAIQYVYQLINSLFKNKLSDIEFEITDKGPFNFEIAGPLPAEFYDYIVHPLAHPLGFVYVYDRIIKIIFEDYYSLRQVGASFSSIKVVCLDLSTGEITEDVYLGEGINRTIKEFRDYYEGEIYHKEYVFDDDTYLKQTTLRNGVSSVTYYDANDNIIKEYIGNCAIQEGGKTYDVELATTDDIDNFQEKTFSEVFSRLGINDLQSWEIGANNLKDADGNYGGTRQENFFAPSFEAQLKILQGKYQQNVEVEVDGVTYIQPIKYTDVVDDSLKVVDSNVTPEAFERQNVGNEDHVARDLLLEKRKYLMFHQETYKEPVIGATENFIDANGVDRGSFGAYAGYVGRDPATIPRLSEMGTLIGSDTAAGDFYGRSVAQYEDKLAVGAVGWDSSTKSDVGIVYLFKKTSSGFVQIGNISAPDHDFYDWFGTSVAVFENRLVVGATGEDTAGDRAGKVYIYECNWETHQFTFVSDIVSLDPSNQDYFGAAVSVFENRLIISATLDDAAYINAGRVFVYDWNGSEYVFVSALTASDAYPNDRFGSAVSLLNDTLVVGADGKFKNNYSNWGKVYVYKWDGSNYIEHSTIEPSDPAYGKRFGFSASLFNDTLIVGAPFDTVNYNGDGSIYTFKWDGSTFEEIDNITATDGSQNEYFGSSVSLYKDSVVVGAYNSNGTTGTTYIFDLFEEVIEDDRLGIYEIPTVGDTYMVGGYFPEYDWYKDENQGFVHTIGDVAIIDTLVDADPVNLQYNTKQLMTSYLKPNDVENWEKLEPTATIQQINNPLDYYEEFEGQIFEFDETFVRPSEVEEWERLEINTSNVSSIASDSYEDIDTNMFSKISFNVNSVTAYQTVPVLREIGASDPFIIGSGYIFEEPVSANTVTGTFEQYDNFYDDADDDFTFGVYRDGVLLEDNNISSL